VECSAMAIEHRNGIGYFYRKVRNGDRVSSVYVGEGELALLARMIDLAHQRKWRLVRLEEKERAEAIMHGDQLGQDNL
jgi:hypothetical protein